MLIPGPLRPNSLSSPKLAGLPCMLLRFAHSSPPATQPRSESHGGTDEEPNP
jgi:hypothetical protein